MKRVILGGCPKVRLSSYLHNVVMGACRVGVCTVGAIAALGACASTPEPQVTKPKDCELKSLKASVITSRRVNLSEEREPRPVQLRLYQLKNDTRFLNSRFDAVWRSDVDTLGDDLLKVDEIPVYPNSRVEMRVEKIEGARFLVAAGLFRNPKGRSWFTSFEFPEPGPQFCDGASETEPEFFVWVEDTRVEDGEAHADEYPEGAGRVLAVSAPSAPKESDAAGGQQANSEGGSKLPDAADVQSGVTKAGDAAQNPPQLPGKPQPQAPTGSGVVNELY